MYVKVDNPYYPPGSLLRAKSDWLRPDHEGIAGRITPSGEQEVIHARERGVEVTNIREFAAGRHIELTDCSRSCGHQRIVLQRAYSRIGSPYNLLVANCEHFSRWAFYGVPDSPQLGRYIGGALLCALIVLGIGNAGAGGGR
jgi:Lecithin retinol acyltransferase